MYCGTRFRSKSSWSLSNDSARNSIIFDVDNSLSSHAHNCKNSFLVLGEDQNFGINGRFRSPEKNIRIDFSKANTKLCLSLHYNADNSYFFVNRKEIFKFKGDSNKVNFPNEFCLRSVPNGFSNTESREVSLNRDMHYFSVD